MVLTETKSVCGGVTAYTACKRSVVRPGQWIVIIGAGGGLGHCMRCVPTTTLVYILLNFFVTVGVQYAVAMGMRVIAVDGGNDKRKLCIDQLKAEEYIDFTQVKDIPAKVKEITKYGAHGSIVFAAAKEGYALGPNVVCLRSMHIRHQSRC